MYAVVDGGKLLGVFATQAEAWDQQALIGGDVQPATFGQETGKVKLTGTWKLEKFNGDVQSPETLTETLEGEI